MALLLARFVRHLHQPTDAIIVTLRDQRILLRNKVSPLPTTVPIHSGETIGPGLLRAILRDVELSVEELEGLL